MCEKGREVREGGDEEREEERREERRERGER